MVQQHTGENILQLIPHIFTVVVLLLVSQQLDLLLQLQLQLVIWMQIVDGIRMQMQSTLEFQV